jgi:processive 1,2-diacylglycerol beta-glucosyltransferase
MIDIYDNDTNTLIGSITEPDLEHLVDVLEEESEGDQDYYIDRATIDLLGDGRATDHFLNMLRTALGDREGIEIRWERR